MKVVDATKPLRFKITAADIAKAASGDPECCVVARGLLRAIKPPKRAEVVIAVGLAITKILVEDTVTRYRTPEPLRDVIRHFDRTGRWKLTPGMYALCVPDHSTAKKKEQRARSARKRRAELKALGIGREKRKRDAFAEKGRKAGKPFYPVVTRRVIASDVMGQL